MGGGQSGSQKSQASWGDAEIEVNGPRSTKWQQVLLTHPPPPACSTRHPQHPPDKRSPNRAPIEVPAQTALGGLAES